MRHFETMTKAKKFVGSMHPSERNHIHIYRKLKGHKNRIKKPFVVGTYFEWLNLY